MSTIDSGLGVYADTSLANFATKASKSTSSKGSSGSYSSTSSSGDSVEISEEGMALAYSLNSMSTVSNATVTSLLSSNASSTTSTRASNAGSSSSAGMAGGGAGGAGGSSSSSSSSSDSTIDPESQNPKPARGRTADPGNSPPNPAFHPRNRIPPGRGRAGFVQFVRQQQRQRQHVHLRLRCRGVTYRDTPPFSPGQDRGAFSCRGVGEPAIAWTNAMPDSADASPGRRTRRLTRAAPRHKGQPTTKPFRGKNGRPL